MRYENTLQNDAVKVSPAGHAVVQVCALAVALSLGALIKLPLPFTPVPVTLQTLPILVAVFFMGPRRAMAGVLLYSGLGLAGVPLFAATLGSTFGYLIGFAAAPWAMTLFRSRAAALAVGQSVIYLFGASWLAWWTGLSPAAALAMGVLPFVAGDALKCAGAYMIVRRFAR